MHVHAFDTEIRLEHPLHDVFAFFSEPHNLNLLTPDWLNFQVVSPPDLVIEAGALIDYRLRWHGIPMRWRSEIVTWEPPYRFVDRQVRGPYKQWVHEHRFQEDERGGTIMHDRVDYAVPGWFLEPWIHRYLVEPDVRRVFAYRREVMRRRFPGDPDGFR